MITFSPEFLNGYIQRNNRFIESQEKDRRTNGGVREELTKILTALENFKTHNPQTFRELCEEANAGSEFSLTDALDAIASACNTLEGN